MSIDEDRIIALKYEVAKLQRDYSHLLKQKKDCEESKYKLEQDIETVNDKLGNELQVKYLEIEQLKSTLDEIKELVRERRRNGEIELAEIFETILAKHEDKK